MSQSKRNRTFRPYPLVGSSVVILLIAILFYGCSPQTRYRVLTFFFTGVPPMEKEESVPVETLQPEIQKTQVQKIVYYSHKFFEDGDCGKCHGTKIRFNTPVSGADRKRIFRKGMEMPGPLLMPAEKICVACHEDKSKNWLEKERLWLHTPAAQGRCVVCHHAHQSTQPFLLLNNREKLCGVCHAGKKCVGNESHAKNANQCLVCHNPHVGINKMMLVKEMKEERSKSPIRTELNAQGNDKD